MRPITETMVRMGELAITADPAEVLVSIGLGSCIGLALLDAHSRVAGLAHIMLPAATAGAGATAKFADTAVPLLVERLERAGALRSRLEAVLVGGAQMFAGGGGTTLDVGARNEEATRAALAACRVPVRAEATGGSTGRTIRVWAEPALDAAVEGGLR
jgi:chemotaxis protein CheD